MRDLTTDVHHEDSGLTASVPERQVPVLVKYGWVVTDPDDDGAEPGDADNNHDGSSVAFHESEED